MRKRQNLEARSLRLQAHMRVSDTIIAGFTSNMVGLSSTISGFMYPDTPSHSDDEAPPIPPPPRKPPRTKQ
ncbi:hypothetical protein HDU90_006919 [Geranomyces variabilis]|nr:hypothetical protein HDU90_006919 [Geranomyces variabilis]